MIKNKDIVSIEKLLDNKKIIDKKLLSDSFNINCIKIKTSDNKNYIFKFYKSKNKNSFNAIRSETNNLIYLNNLKLNFFPKIYSNDDMYMVISYMNNDGIAPSKTKDDFLNAIISMHSLSKEGYGFNFDTQIGGLKQPNNQQDNWVDFYREFRLGYIFELINSNNSMEKLINFKIEKLLKNLEDFIPKKPKASLLHGDLWEGNILFNNKDFIGFIDPGSFYGHNELEISYLRWFNPVFVDDYFLKKYNDVIKISKDYLTYEPIYQLYYSLLNVYLWDRKYVNDVKRLLNKVGIN